MRRAETTVAVLGIAVTAWSLLTLVWQEPFTRIEHWHTERALAATLAVRDRSAHITARRYRLHSHDGEVMGRIAIPRIRLNALLVDGTSEPDLAKGPGFYRGDFLPGEGRLVYIAGHRTIFGAPFSHLDALRRGDLVVLAMPYGRFAYRVTGHRIVPATALGVLRTGRHEQLILQTCHPRYSASHRYLVYATPDQGGE
jgi:sortase A